MGWKTAPLQGGPLPVINVVIAIYNPYKWPYKWVGGPPCWSLTCFAPEKDTGFEKGRIANVTFQGRTVKLPRCTFVLGRFCRFCFGSTLGVCIPTNVTFLAGNFHNNFLISSLLR